MQRGHVCTLTAAAGCNTRRTQYLCRAASPLSRFPHAGAPPAALSTSSALRSCALAAQAVPGTWCARVNFLPQLGLCRSMFKFVSGTEDSAAALVAHDAAHHEEARVVGRRCVGRLLGHNDDGVSFLSEQARFRCVSLCRVSQSCRTHGCRTKHSVQSNEEESHKLLDYYVEERGGNFIDVAEMYPAPASDPRWMPGVSEEIIGRWFAKKPEVRSKVILATKVRVYQPQCAPRPPALAPPL